MFFRLLLLSVFPPLAMPVGAELIGHFPLNEHAGSTFHSTVGPYTATRGDGFGMVLRPDEPILDFCYHGWLGGPESSEHGDALGYLQTDHPGVSGSSPRSVSIWFRTDPDGGDTTDTGNLDALFGWGQQTTNRRYDFRVSGGNDLRIEISGSGYNFPVAAQGIDIRDEQWHHVLLAYRGGALANHQLFVDGRFIGNATGTATLNTAVSTRVRIGSGAQRHDGSSQTGRDFDGFLDDFGIFDSALGANDAALINGLARVAGLDLRHFPAAQDLALGLVGEVHRINGRDWVKVDDLEGAVGSFGGSLDNDDAYVVLAADGLGIRLYQTPGNSPADAFRLSPENDFALSTGFGQGTTLPLTIENTTAEYLRWKMVFEGQPASPPDLVESLDRLDGAIDHILEPIPDRFLFPGGELGDEISGGSDGMYSRGNQINLSHEIVPYSNRLVRSFAAGDDGAQYFTRKYDGFWVFAANLDGIEQFAVNSDFRGNGSQDFSVSEVTLIAGGRPYRGFIKQVHGTHLPSVNHLTIVPDDPGITRVHRNDTQSEGYGLLGLEQTSHLYYLLFSRPDGGFYDDATIAEVGRRFLDSVAGPPNWFLAPRDSELVAPQQGRSFELALPADGLAPGQYSTRFAIVPDTVSAAEVQASLFRELTLTVEAPEFTLASESITVIGLSRFAPEGVRLPIVPDVPGRVVNGLEVECEAPWVIPSISENRINVVDFDFDPSGLSAGTHQATATVLAGGTTHELELTLHLMELDPIVMKPDPARNRVYAINRSGSGEGALLAIDPATAAITEFVPLGRRPSDFDLSPDGQSLFAINAVDETISVIDLDTLTVAETISLPVYENWNTDVTEAHVRAGPGDIIYYVDGSWEPQLHVLNRATGTVLQSPNLPRGDGVGGLVIRPDFSSLFAWTQVGWSAGSTGTTVVRLDLEPDGTLAFHSEAPPDPFTSQFERDPLSTPALISADGSRLVIKDRVINPDNLTDQPVIYPREIFAMTPGGEVVAHARDFLNGRNGTLLDSLPDRTSIMTITPDYARLVYFYLADRSLRSADLVDTLGPAALGLDPFPEDGSTVPVPDQLRWKPLEAIRSYDVYFGDDPGAVAAAGPNDPEFLATTRHRFLPLSPDLLPGQTYHWRIVPRARDGSALPAMTSSFQVAGLIPSASSLRAETVAGVSLFRTSLGLDATEPANWSAQSSTPWISFEADSGITPTTLSITIDASELAPGFHDGEIVITSGASSIVIPFTLTLSEPHYTIAVADRERPLVYAISQQPQSDSATATLLVFDTEGGEIISAHDVGNSVTDLAIHYRENRIYIPNWEPGVLRAFDRDTFEPAQEYSFAPAGDGTGDVFRVSATSEGRIVVEGGEESTTIRLIDTADGSVLSETGADSGIGDSSPDGRFYYHGDNRNTSDSIQKYDLAGDALVLTAETASLERPVFTPVIFGVQDGDGVVWNGTRWDTDLSPLFDTRTPLYSGTSDGRLLFSRTDVYNGSTGDVIAPLPFQQSRVQAVTSDDKELYLFYEDSLTVVEIAELVPLPPFELVPTLADRAPVIGTNPQLDWSAAQNALEYQVYLGTDRDEVEAAEPGGPQHLGTSASPSWGDPLPVLSLGTTYYWRVDVVGLAESRSGPVWSFDISPVDLATPTGTLLTPRLAALPTQELQLRSDSPQDWSAASSQPWLTLPAASGSSPGCLAFEIDSSGLPTGSHEAKIILTVGGQDFPIPVTVEVRELTISRLLADPSRDAVYALMQNDDAPGWLLAFDPARKTFTRSLQVGRRPVDFAISNDGDDLFVLNYSDPSISRIDLATFTQRDSRTLDVFEIRDLSNNDHLWPLAADLAVGPGSTLYYLDGEPEPFIHVFDYETRTVLQRTGFRELHPDFGVGDFVVNTERTLLHAWRQDRVTGVSSTFLGTFAIAPDGTLAPLTSIPKDPPFRFGFATQAHLSADGERLIMANLLVDQLAPNGSQPTYPAGIASISANAEIAVSSTHIYEGATGRVLAELLSHSGASAVTSDYSTLVYFDTTAADIRCLELHAILRDEIGLEELPADGSTVIAPDRLTWLPQTGVHEYHVYLGTDPDDVAIADRYSPLALGTANYPFLGLQGALQPGATYYWRVDSVRAGEITPGSLRTFTVSPLTLDTTAVSARLVEGTTGQLFDVALQSGGTPIQWNAFTDAPWLSFEPPYGQTPDTLRIRADASSLEPGIHESEVTVTTDGATATINVRLDVVVLQVSHLETHPSRPLIYGLSQDQFFDSETAFLFQFDSDSETITKSVEIGVPTTDLTLHLAENRIYTSHWNDELVRAFDLDTLELLREYQLPPSGQDPSSPSYYRYVCAGPAGRIVVNWSDADRSAILIDTATGNVLDTLPGTTASRGTFDRDGSSYYHVTFSTQSPTLTKYDLSVDSFREAAAYAGNLNVDGTIYFTLDGSRLVARRQVFDRDLNLLANLDTTAEAATSGGEFLFSQFEVIMNGRTGRIVGELPEATFVMAVSSDDRKLFIPDDRDRRIINIFDLAEELGLDPADLQPVIPDGRTIIGNEPVPAWQSLPAALSHDVYFGTDPAAVQSAGRSDAEFLGAIVESSLPLPSPLDYATTYYWRVEVESLFGPVQSPLWSFRIAPIDLAPRTAQVVWPLGFEVAEQSALVSAPTPTGWSASSTTPWLTVLTASGQSGESLHYRIDPDGLALGVHPGAIALEAAGESLDLDVTFELVTLAVRTLEPDHDSDHVYGVHFPGDADRRAFLLRIDAREERIDAFVPAGTWATDLALHLAENRLYVGDPALGELHAFDVGSLTLERRYDVGPADRGDRNAVALVSAGASGRLAYEGTNQSINLNLLDTVSGTILHTVSERAGDGEFDPAGRYYYHGDSSSSGARFTKYDTINDIFEEVADTRTSAFSGFGSASVRISGDGSRLFWNGTMFDPDLNELWAPAQVIRAVDRTGLLVASEDTLYNADSQTPLLALEPDSAQRAISTKARKLISFVNQTLTFTDLSGYYPAGARAVVPSDSDHDGFSDIFEETLGMDPFVPDSAVPMETGIEGGQFVLRFRVDPLADGGDCQLESSTDLRHWTPLDPSVLSIVQRDGHFMAEAMIPLTDDPQQFLRVRVTPTSE